MDENILCAAAAIYLRSLMVIKMKSRRKRKTWTKLWHKRKNEGRGILNMLNTELSQEDPTSYRNFIRLKSDQFNYILNLIKPLIEKQDTLLRQCVSAKNRLEVALRFLATGESYRSLMYATRIHESTISIFVPEVIEALYIYVLQSDHLQTPCAEESWHTIAQGFEDVWQFPHCLGALDGRHIKFRPPRSSGSYYFNYKGEHSLVLLAMADAHYKFIYVNMGVNGKTSDGGVFRESNLSSALSNNELNFPLSKRLPGRTEKVPFVVVADNAFPLTTRMLKPYPQRNLNYSKTIFNYRLSRARRVIENAFGILANRFRVLLNPINLGPHKVEITTLACVSLHNYLSTVNGNTYTNINVQQECNLQKIRSQCCNRAAMSGATLRDEYKSYFCSPEGQVDWQDAAIAKSNL